MNTSHGKSTAAITTIYMNLSCYGVEHALNSFNFRCKFRSFHIGGKNSLQSRPMTRLYLRNSSIMIILCLERKLFIPRSVKTNKPLVLREDLRHVVG